MKADILPDGRMKLTVSDDERKILGVMQEELGPEFHCDETMTEWFESFIANSEYDWVRPEECGDLTDAPMIGIYAEPRRKIEEDSEHIRLAGHWDGVTWVQDVVKRWAWMNYQVQSLLEALLAEGEAILEGGSLK